MESFVYTVSHDLKTPIVTIEGFIGALREDFADRLSETGEQYLRYMSDAARKMEVLINDLLNLSRIGRVTEAKRNFLLATCVREAMETLRPQMEARGIEVHIQAELPVVYGERKRISQVVDNLLNPTRSNTSAKTTRARVLRSGVWNRTDRRCFLFVTMASGLRKDTLTRSFRSSNACRRPSRDRRGNRHWADHCETNRRIARRAKFGLTRNQAREPPSSSLLETRMPKLMGF